MKFAELREEVAKYLHTDDDGMFRVAFASVIATRMKLGDPVWLLVIGPSSSGKSQVLRPLALTDEKFIHRVDDLTENTFLSGAVVKKGEKDVSLLKRIGAAGIIVISDLTVIFSKNSESRDAILGQLRMVYDGEMTKFSGVKSEPITWKGSLGVVAGSTPSAYRHFEEIADMGERFIYYRMKPYDVEMATRRSLQRTVYGKELDTILSDLYGEYIKECVLGCDGEVPELSPEVRERVVKIAMFAAILRTPTHYDRYMHAITHIPVPEMPMRVALQLSALAKGLMVMRYHESGEWALNDDDIAAIEWTAYSLANEERRACLGVLAHYDFGEAPSASRIADDIGLSTDVVKMNLQHLVAAGVLLRTGDSGALYWSFASAEYWGIVRRLEGITTALKAEKDDAGDMAEFAQNADF